MSNHSGFARTECMTFIPDSACSVLDVGCSDGLFGEALQRLRPELDVTGMEIDPTTASAAKARLDKVIVGSFPEALPADAMFDCITFLDCLEHLVDPWAALRSAARHLNPGGCVVASLPNIQYAAAIWTIAIRGRWPFDEAGHFDRTHLRFFTRSSMRELFEASGFDVDQQAPINVSVDRRHRALSLLLTRDILPMQFVVVGRPRVSGGRTV
jgi:2-polyprenyl-3-methyl-5-hydroxy-6-metoxy-1,4-benzoquinol methylase